MKNEINKKQINEVLGLSKKILNLIYIAMIVGIIFLVTLLIKEWGILRFILTVLNIATPFFIGFVIAWIFNPLVIKLEKRKISRGLASAIVYLVFLLVLFLFFYFLIPTIYTQLNDLIVSIPNIITQLEEWVSNIITNINGIDLASAKASIFSSMEGIISSVTTNLPQVILDSVGSIFSGLGTVLISLVIGIYMLIDFNNINGYLMKFIPSKYQNDTQTLISDIGQEVRKCVNGTLLVAFMVFVGDSIGFMAVGLKAPILFGLLCGITDLIPYIGPYIGGIAAVIVGFSQGTFIGIAVTIIVVVVQLLENYVLQPVVMSKTMKLHPVTIMLGLLIFGHFFGIVGMVLATPTIALIKVIYRFFAKKYNWLNFNNNF
ncbi:MAG: AI-2E family transporter [Bacilli bacterium]|nr:AI-2E family transporter [Bacilli bacterium]